MGGDVAVALAGTDERVARVAAIASTPDWMRPGMRDLWRPTHVLGPGEADAYARWFYDPLDPLTHIDAYERGPAIAFECGADDAHVPPDGALRFRAALHEAYPQAAEPVRVSGHPGFGHMDGAKHYAGAALPDWLREISKRYATEAKKQR